MSIQTLYVLILEGEGTTRSHMDTSCKVKTLEVLHIDMTYLDAQTDGATQHNSYDSFLPKEK